MTHYRDCESCREDTVGLGVTGRLYLVDEGKLPYSEGSMDGIFMCFTLELFDTPDIPKVLA